METGVVTWENVPENKYLTKNWAVDPPNFY
jgi:hypothetical protein